MNRRPYQAPKLSRISPDDPRAVAMRENVTVIDLPGLRLARDVLRRHRSLLGAADKDLHDDGGFDGPLDDVIRAIGHVLEDGFRSDETRGGS